jgi:hypothetical protein
MIDPPLGERGLSALPCQVVDPHRYSNPTK